MKQVVQNFVFGGNVDYTPVLMDYYNVQFLNYEIATKTEGVDIYTSIGSFSYSNNINPTKNYALDITSQGTQIDLLSVKTTEQVRLYFRGGRSDVVSMALTTFNSVNGSNYIIPDWYTFLNQYRNLNSVRFFLARQTNAGSNLPKIEGNMIRLPKQLEYILYNRIYVDNLNLFYTDFDNINGDNQLKYFKIDLSLGNTPKVVGDLKNLPVTLQYFKVQNFGTGSNSTYTGVGKVFNSIFDTFHYNRVLATALLDQLLIDLAASITTAIGDKIIFLRGTRSSASDAAVTYLTGLGFTVTIDP